jgi:50S ribosomal subunit-associated GTPase HflX
MDCFTETVRAMLVPVEVALPYDRSELVAQCYENGKVHRADYTPEHILVKADISRDLAGRLEPWVLNKNSDFYRRIEGGVHTD